MEVQKQQIYPWPHVVILIGLSVTLKEASSCTESEHIGFILRFKSSVLQFFSSE